MVNTLASSISTTITNGLLKHLPGLASERFSVSEEEFKTFLNEFLQEELVKPSKGKRASGPKGTNGRGRINSYVVFARANRERVNALVLKENKELVASGKAPEGTPDLSVDGQALFREVNTRLGSEWKSLSADEKSVWTKKAVEENEANGLPTPSPAPAKKAATTPSTSTPKVVKRGKVWAVEGTDFVVKSSKNKVVVGRMSGDKVVKLRKADHKTVEDLGFKYE